ncbi:MAG: AbrB/MazE/SpoVT family DNA-binding domain-containing protein [Terracidiphilus sp.]|jgi:AbrB family looped-hinge helix DNA binding protein
MPIAKVTSKGQITIPAEIRKALKVVPGTRIDFYQDSEGRFVLAPITGSIRDLEGCAPKLDHVPTIEEMNEAIGDAIAESYLRSVARPATSESGELKGEAA